MTIITTNLPIELQGPEDHSGQAMQLAEVMQFAWQWVEDDLAKMNNATPEELANEDRNENLFPLVHFSQHQDRGTTTADFIRWIAPRRQEDGIPLETVQTWITGHFRR